MLKFPARYRYRSYGAVLALLFATQLTGCATNPVTGDSEFRFPGASAQAIAAGKAQYAPMRQSQGGDFNIDPELTAYVDGIGQRLAQISNARTGQNFQYEFSVLNNSVPNAWALPGGKIALNRGLLTEMNSEAELAAVIGHEIVHAAAEHSADQMSKGMLLQGAMIATQIGTSGKDYAQLAQLGANVGGQMAMAKFGRTAELESDEYGMLFMSKAGYDPQGAVDLQKTFVRLKNGRNPDWLSGLFASHPPSEERVAKNIETASRLPAGGEIGAERFRQKTAFIRQTKPAYEAHDQARKALAEGDIATASARAETAVSMVPQESLFHALKGDIAITQKNYDTARSHFNKALSLNDNFFYHHLQRGLINSETGNLVQARQDLENSVQLLPSLPAYYHLGNIARKSGDTAAAKQYYAKVAQNAGNSDIGRAAYSSLMELDLAQNPQAYLKVQTGYNNGSMLAQISNPTPRDVTGLVLVMQYTDASGRVRQGSKSVSGVLRSGDRQVIDLGIQNPTQQMVQTFRAQVSQARLTQQNIR